MNITKAAVLTLPTLRRRLLLAVTENFTMTPYHAIGIILTGLLCFYLIELTSLRSPRVQVPVVGYRCMLEPTWFVRLRFIWAGGSIVRDGYERYKSSIFQIRKLGTDIVIIPPNHIDEVRRLSKDSTRSVEPFINDFAGTYTHGMPFLESDLQNVVIQKKLTPKLAVLTTVMQEELDFALSVEMPNLKENEWTEIDIATILTRIISRISARVFLGPENSRDEEWLTTTTEYSKSLFITGFLLRIFPHVLRPFVAPLLPSYRQLLRNVSSARRIICSILRSRESQAETVRNSDQDVLQFMTESATGRERAPENLAQRMLILSLASIHTTAITMTHAMYDLCAHPEYLEPLRQEMADVLADGGWQKTTLNRLYKLDSLLKESQRFHPVFLQFDAFRYSKIRQQPEAASKHLFSMTDCSNMAFGYGKYACPGRFYASNEMKLVLTSLLLRYDFKFPNGKRRPQNITIDSDMFPDPGARLCVRIRAPVK
ncbi:hypothetical protein E4U41_006538 [Claviceps citrina]|nr:hypothetical protein E4U41_006538 [Claviceps citrina]